MNLRMVDRTREEASVGGRLAGKTALVTAAGQGIGRASAEAMAAEGAHVFATDAKAGTLESLAGRANIETRVLDVLDDAAIRRTLADERGRWILRHDHREAHSEWELSGVSGGRLRNVKIDRSFVDERGTRWVIDYKTSRHEGGDLEGFLAQELERYRPQLEGYLELARSLGREPVRAALYFPLLGEFRAVA